MVKGRDDFVIALRSVFLKKKDQQKFSLISLIILSVFIIILSNFNFRPIKLVKLGINEVIYRSSYIVSVPEATACINGGWITTGILLFKSDKSRALEFE